MLASDAARSTASRTFSHLATGQRYPQRPDVSTRRLDGVRGTARPPQALDHGGPVGEDAAWTPERIRAAAALVKSGRTAPLRLLKGTGSLFNPVAVF